MPREPSFTGTSDKVWKKENSPKLEKIWLPLKRTTKRLELKPLKDKEKKKVELTSEIFYKLLTPPIPL